MLDARNLQSAVTLIPKASLVLLAGGHVPTQNRFFHRLALDALLKDFAGTVMGISAGAMNMAKVVYAQPEEPGESLDPAYDRFPEGLGLTEIQVLPHYQNTRSLMLDGKRLFEEITFPDSRGHRFLAIPDGSYVLKDQSGAFLYGEGFFIQDGKIVPAGRPGNRPVQLIEGV